MRNGKFLQDKSVTARGNLFGAIITNRFLLPSLLHTQRENLA
jgi:hypothetical protein